MHLLGIATGQCIEYRIEVDLGFEWKKSIIWWSLWINVVAWLTGCKKGSIDGISWGFRDGKTCFDAFPAYRANRVLPGRTPEVAGDTEIEKTGYLSSWFLYLSFRIFLPPSTGEHTKKRKHVSVQSKIYEYCKNRQITQSKSRAEHKSQWLMSPLKLESLIQHCKLPLQCWCADTLAAEI